MAELGPQSRSSDSDSNKTPGTSSTNIYVYLQMAPVFLTVVTSAGTIAIGVSAKGV